MNVWHKGGSESILLNTQDGGNIYQFHTEKCLDLNRDVLFHEQLRKKTIKKEICIKTQQGNLKSVAGTSLATLHFITPHSLGLRGCSSMIFWSNMIYWCNMMYWCNMIYWCYMIYWYILFDPNICTFEGVP